MVVDQEELVLKELWARASLFLEVKSIPVS